MIDMSQTACPYQTCWQNEAQTVTWEFVSGKNLAAYSDKIRFREDFSSPSMPHSVDNYSKV